MLKWAFKEGEGSGGGGDQERAAKRARVFGESCNGAANEITIGNTTPEAFKALLRYLYTD